MTARKFAQKWYQTQPPAVDLAWHTVLLVGFHPLTDAYAGIDEFPNVTQSSYHTIVMSHEATLESIKAVWHLAERVIHLDGVKHNKQELIAELPKPPGEYPAEVNEFQKYVGINMVVWWFTDTDEGEGSVSTVIMKDGWHSHCNACGACCSPLWHPKGTDPMKAFNVSCDVCHGGSVCTVPCPNLKVSRHQATCANYDGRPRCCRKFPAAHPMCAHVDPTCPVFNLAYIQDPADLKRMWRGVKRNAQAMYKAGMITKAKFDWYFSAG